MSEEPIRNPLVYHGCFACSSRETCPDAFYSNAVHCNAYGKLEIVKREGGNNEQI